MIVKCEQCQTRFKIPDEKVTQKGVKVRCTKCQHTFRVKRDATVATMAGTSSSDDPFAKFGSLSQAGQSKAPVPSSPTAPPPPREVVEEPSPFDFAAAMGEADPPGPVQFDSAFSRATPNPPGADNPFATGESVPSEPEAPSVFGTDGDFFASNEAPPSSQWMPPDGLDLNGGSEVIADTSQRAALFEMPSRAIPAVSKSLEPLRQAPVAGSPRLGPVNRPSSPLEPSEVASVKTNGALVFKVAVATGLLALLTVTTTVYLSDGTLEASSFSVARLKAAFSPGAGWAAFDISNGLYDTQSGRPVFFVRGEVKNRGSKATRAKIRAEIFDGNVAIRHADVSIGTTLTPEALYSISKAEDVERLVGEIEKSAAEIKPGESRSFLVPFFEYPSDLKGARVRVTVIDSLDEKTAPP